MNLIEYKQKIAKYSEFAEIVRNILLKDANNKNLKLHHTSFRAKDSKSLQEKIKKEKYSKENHDSIESFITDLAGCRLVFYHRSDIDKFINLNIIQENFDIKKTKEHLQNKDSRKVEDCYRGIHYVVKLKKNRSDLPEYGIYKDMWCEIQLHSALDNVFFQINHDITYKKFNIGDKIGKKRMEVINKMLNDVFNKYLTPAQREFEKTRIVFDRLIQGKNLIDSDKLNSAILGKINDNNVLYDFLEKYRVVMPDYNEIDTLVDEAFKLCKSSLKVSKKNKSPTIKTPWQQEFEGRKSEEVIHVCFDILNNIRYHMIGEMIPLLLNYSLDENQNTVKKVNEVIKNISKYNIHLLQKAGLAIHFSILEELKKLSPEDKIKYSSATSLICGNLLSCETSATSSSYDSLTFHRGSITVSDNFQKIRSEAISVLKEIYDLLSNSDLEDKTKRKIEIISSLGKACLQNSQSSKNDEEYYKLFNLILENAKEIVEFYISKIDEADYRILLSIDGDMARLHHRSFGINETNTTNPEVIKTNDELVHLIEEFRDKLNQDKEFLIYRDLVSGWGYLSIYRSYYGHDENTKQNELDKIDGKITNYAKSIDKNNLDEWLDRIFKVIKDYDSGEQPFRAFNLLNKIVKLNPKLGFRILHEREKEITESYDKSFNNSVILSILSGLVEEREEEVKQQITSYLKEDKYFKECVLAIGYSKGDLDIELMKNALKKAKDKIEAGKAESDILLTFIRSVENYIKPFDKGQKKTISKEIKDFLLSVIKLLTLNKNGQLTNDIFYGSLITRLAENADSKDEIQIILDNLLFDRKIHYGCEEILAQIAKKYPDKVIEFFDKRLDLEVADKNYDAIPYELYNKSLIVELANNAKQLFAMARKRFEDDDYLFEYRAAKIFKIVFTNFAEGFEKELIKLVKTEDKKDFDFVTRILRSYTELNEYGEIERLHNVCKEIIKSPLYDEEGELYTELAIILTNSGMMSGKYGIAEKHERKVQEISDWKNDSNNKIIKFYNKFSESELKYAQEERERADQEEELRNLIEGK